MNTVMPVLQIGKSGITENVIKKTKELLKKHKIIKVKFLPTIVKGNKKQLAEKLAKETNSKIVKQVGFVIVLRKN